VPTPTRLESAAEVVGHEEGVVAVGEWMSVSWSGSGLAQTRLAWSGARAAVSKQQWMEKEDQRQHGDC
jgi:hypothetical protein